MDRFARIMGNGCAVQTLSPGVLTGNGTFIATIVRAAMDVLQRNTARIWTSKTLSRAGLLLLGLATLQTARAFEATLEWDANSEENVAGYRVYVGTQSREYSVTLDAGNQTQKRVLSLEAGQMYFFAVTAYTADGLESPFSDEVSYTVAIDNTNVVLVPLTVTRSRVTSAITISFNTQASQSCYVQASTDLQLWQTVCTNVAVLDGLFEWTDAAAPGLPRRFYRVIRTSP